MARPKAFDKDAALSAAIGLFSQRGYEGTSASDLVKGMGIGRQSLYNTFGDKWQLYLAALSHYINESVRAQLEALRVPSRALDGVAAQVALVIEDAIADASPSCLGVGATCEFGRREPEVKAVIDRNGHRLTAALAARIREGQGQGDIATTVIPDEAAAFILAVLMGVKVAARAGITPGQLRSMGAFALKGIQ
jgi:TetR/AcrR family transcriptional repressor of nem operon